MLSLVVLSYISVSHGRVNTSQVVHKGTGHLTRCLKVYIKLIFHNCSSRTIGFRFPSQLRYNHT